MNAVTTIAPKLGVIASMAEEYGMSPEAFERTIRSTCMRPDKNGREATKEEFAALCLIAKKYTLNPILKEIHAFAGKGGGIVPIVGVDGWISLVHRHPDYDGEEWEEHHDDAGNLVAMTCRLFHKNRERPTVIKERTSECIRGTDPWKMLYRMMRHKSFIQAARYAFGFSGIFDEDEAQDIMQREDATPRRVAPPAGRITNNTRGPVTVETNGSTVTIEGTTNAPADANSAAAVEVAGSKSRTPEPTEPAMTTETIDEETGEIMEEETRVFDPDSFTDELCAMFGDCRTPEELTATWTDAFENVDLETMLLTEHRRRINEVFTEASDRIGAGIRESAAAAAEIEDAAAAAAETEAQRIAAKAAEVDPPADTTPIAEEPKTDPKRASLVKAFANTLGHFATEDDVSTYWSETVLPAHKAGDISTEDLNGELIPAHDNSIKRIKAGLTRSVDAPDQPQRFRRSAPPAPTTAEAAPAKPADPDPAPTTAAKGVDPASNEGQELLARAFKAGRMRASTAQQREPPKNMADDPALAESFFKGYDSVKKT